MAYLERPGRLHCLHCPEQLQVSIGIDRHVVAARDQEVAEIQVELHRCRLLPEVDGARGPDLAGLAVRRSEVIEDEALVRMFVVDQLNDLGFDVIDASSAADGLRAARNHEQLDVAIVDRGLPDRDGLDVVTELRTQLPSLPVIVASGYGDLPDHAALRNDARIRFMSKPYDIDALTTALRALHVRTKEMR